MTLLRILIAMLMVSACRQASRAPAVPNVFDQEGEHKFNGDFFITVYKADNLISGTVRRNGVDILAHHPRASNYSTWFYYWDESSMKLWFYSGDVGTDLWQLEGDGFVEKNLDVAEAVSMVKKVKSLRSNR
jgi:hypothetical protein